MLAWLRALLRAGAGEAPAEGDAAAPARGAQAEALRGRARTALAEARVADAITALEAAVDLGADAATHRLLAEARAAGGDAEGALDELQLAVHLQPGDAEARVALAEQLLHSGRRDEAAELCAQPLPAAPDAALHQRFARCLKQLGRHADAIAQYRAALAQAPRDTGILSALGLAQAEVGDYEAADASYARALEIDPDCVEALHNLALLRREQGALDAARALFERALALRPRSLETQSALAHALRDLGRFDEALALYRKVLERRPETVDALLNRSYALLMSGQLGEGWDAYERRLGFPEPPLPIPEGVARWGGEAGAAVHVAAEQGLGDQIMFASCLPDLLRRAATVSLSCDARLAPLFGRSFPGVALRAPQEPPPAGHRWLALGSLPRHFRRRADDFPDSARYLRADPDAVARWRERLAGIGPAPRIGLSWRGGTLRTRARLRSIPAEALGALARISGTCWVSLQYGSVDDDVARLRATLGLHHWDEAAQIDECAALIEALDAVVTIDTTVAHLAGALGRRSWILLSQAAEWRWHLGSESAVPWYPSARLLRQEAAGDWSGVLEALVRQLGEALDTRTAA